MTRRTRPVIRSSSATAEAFQRETKPRFPSLVMTVVYGSEAGMCLKAERSKRGATLPSLALSRMASSEAWLATSRRFSLPLLAVLRPAGKGATFLLGSGGFFGGDFLGGGEWAGSL